MQEIIEPEHQFSKVCTVMCNWFIKIFLLFQIKLFYGVWSPTYLELTALHPNISFHDGVPTDEIEQILSDEDSGSQTRREPELWSRL